MLTPIDLTPIMFMDTIRAQFSWNSFIMKLTGLTPILNVSDVGASIGWFEKLGWKRGFTWNDGGMMTHGMLVNAHGPASFGSVSSGECEIFLCRGAQGSRGSTTLQHVRDEDTGGVWMTWWLSQPSEVNEAHALAVQHGMIVSWPPTDYPWGVRECGLVHPDGHTFRISAALCEEK